jgi:hypothetical protein
MGSFSSGAVTSAFRYFSWRKTSDAVQSNQVGSTLCFLARYHHTLYTYPIYPTDSLFVFFLSQFCKGIARDELKHIDLIVFIIFFVAKLVEVAHVLICCNPGIFVKLLRSTSLFWNATFYEHASSDASAGRCHSPSLGSAFTDAVTFRGG